MQPEIIAANVLEHDTLLRNLYQLYLYEFTRIVEGHVTPAGRFEESDLDGCWTRSGRHVFIVKFEGHIAGFVILDDSYIEASGTSEPVRYMAEFFIMARFQKRGIGEKVAFACFDRFPGKWKVSELIENVNAQHFWRKIIGRYTGGKMHETTLYDGRVVAQYFDTADRVK